MCKFWFGRRKSLFPIQFGVTRLKNKYNDTWRRFQQGIIHKKRQFFKLNISIIKLTNGNKVKV